MGQQAIIEQAWEERNNINSSTTGDVRDAVEFVLDQVDGGELRVAEKVGKNWKVHQWVKKAILLSFRFDLLGWFFIHTLTVCLS